MHACTLTQDSLILGDMKGARATTNHTRRRLLLLPNMGHAVNTGGRKSTHSQSSSMAQRPGSGKRHYPSRPRDSKGQPVGACGTSGCGVRDRVALGHPSAATASSVLAVQCGSPVSRRETQQNDASRAQIPADNRASMARHAARRATGQKTVNGLITHAVLPSNPLMLPHAVSMQRRRV